MNELSPRVRTSDLPIAYHDIGGTLEQSQPPTLHDYWRIIKKHRLLILSVAGGVVLTTLLVTLLMTPIYTAETILLLDPADPQIVNIKPVTPEPQRSGEEHYYQTQYEMLKSRSLIAKVIDQEQLASHPAYRKEAEKRDSVLFGWLRGWFAKGHKADDGQYPKLTKVYLERILEVKPVKDSRLVTIAISTPDPELSARLANAHAKAYIAEGLNIRNRASKEALAFLEAKAKDLRLRLQASEAALNAFRREKGIVSLDEKENVVVDRLADLNRRLTEAEVDKIALESQAIMIRNRDYDSLPAVINNPLIQDLKKQLSALEAEAANLDALYMPAHPKMQQIKAQIDQSRRKLDKEIKSVVGGIESAYLSAQRKERDLRAAMSEQKNATLNLKDAAVQYAVLARDVDTSRQLYDHVFQRIKELGVSAELPASSVSILDRAATPEKPSKPNKLLYLAISGIVGLTGGLGLAFLREYFDNTLRTPDDVERYLHLPSIAVVPEFSTLNGVGSPEGTANSKLPLNLRSGRKELVLAHHPHSAVSEAYSMLHTSILLSRADEPPRCLLFASARPGEGKTVNVLNTGIVISRTGARTLIIDADLRGSRCAKVMGVKNERGLTEVLTGQIGLFEAIQSTDVDFLSMIPSGTIPPAPAALLGSRKMRDTLAELRQHYDFILIDSSPIIPVTDAVRLSPLMDGVILVINSQVTPSHIVSQAHSRLKYARANILGVLLNQVDLRDEKISEYYPSYYYPASA
jgi:polysaccharide biosynthesis transport protein